MYFYSLYCKTFDICENKSCKRDRAKNIDWFIKQLRKNPLLVVRLKINKVRQKKPEERVSMYQG